MTNLLSSDISISSDREHLILPLELEESEIAAIIDKRAEVLKTLRATQMNPAGFYTVLPGSLRRELYAASWVVLKVETTAPTRFSAAGRLSATARIGSEDWTAYRAANPGARINTRARMRVLCVYTDALGACAWDLDALRTEDCQALFRAVVDNKIVIAHNAGIDLSWLFTETAARPRFVLDSMLLMRHLRPETLLRPFGIAAVGDGDVRRRAEELLEKERGEPSASLEWMAASLNLQAPDGSYQAYANWCVSMLSAPHHAYATAAVRLPLSVVQFLLPGVCVLEMPAVIESKYPWYVPFGAALVRLAEAHARGVPFDLEAAEALRSEWLAELTRAADDLAQFPEFAGLHKQLASPRVGETNELKSALAMHAKTHGARLGQTKSGASSTGQQAAKTSGADKLPAWNALEKLKTSKNALRMVAQYNQAAKIDGKLHSQVNFVAATGRSTSSEPTLQNVPRDSRFRALIKARPGHLILSADYAAIELRIAAVLAERAVSDLRRHVEGGSCEGWFMQLVEAGVMVSQKLRCPPEPKALTIDWLNASIPAVAQTVLRRDIQMMMSIFHRGLDPHLVTALDMAHRQGRGDCGQNPVEWLASKDKQTQAEMKSQWQDERQQAKPTNFGLLYRMGAEGLYNYGISNYGLSWVPEEAAQARHAWFELYPEFRLWQFWTMFRQSQKISQGKCAIWNSYERKLVIPEHKVKIYQTSTLVGRPFVILDNFRQALNYQDQGTGADILALAVASLPEEIAAMLLFPVHDELVFEVPANDIVEVKEAVLETMTHAADKVLGGQIPVEVESVIGEVWQKG